MSDGMSDARNEEREAIERRKAERGDEDFDRTMDLAIQDTITSLYAYASSRQRCLMAKVGQRMRVSEGPPKSRVSAEGKSLAKRLRSLADRLEEKI